MTDDEEFRIRRNHRDEWAKLDAKFARLARFLPPVSYWLRFWLWVLAIVAAVLVLVWIGGAR